MERAVEFVGLNHRIGTFGREQKVGIVVAEHPAEKCVAPHLAVVENVGGHRRGCCFAVCAGKADAFALAGHLPQKGGALHHFKSPFAEVGHNRCVGGHGGSVDNECVGGIAERCRNGSLHVVDEGDGHPFILKLGCEGGWGAVVAGYVIAFCEEVALEGGHSDAACTDEVYVGHGG